MMTFLLLLSFALIMTGFVSYVVMKRMPDRQKQVENRTPRGKGMLESFIDMFRGTERARPQTSTAAPPPPPRIETDPDMKGLPENARPHVRTINALMTQIEKRIEGDPMGIPLVVEMTQMRDVHLPRLCRSYVEIPEAHRRDIYARTGKSASFHLNESLTAMESRLMEIDKALAQSHIATFEQNADIVRNTYGRNSNPLA